MDSAPSDTDAPTRSGHVALTGLPNVGKSTLLNNLVGEHLGIVSPKPQATRLPVVGIRTDPGVQYVFHDLPGLLEPSYLLQERMREAALAQLARSDVILHLHPATDAPAPEFQAVAGLDRPPKAPVLKVYTKGDLVTGDERARLAGSGGLVTSEEGGGIPELLTAIRPHLPERPFQYDPEDIGTQPLRFFVEEYLREAAFDQLEEEVPYSFTAQVEEFRENDHPVYIRVTLYVERESQKGILIGAGGRTIRAIGTQARRRLEQLMGAKVYLDARVKVAANWRRNAAALERLGYRRAGSDS